MVRLYIFCVTCSNEFSRHRPELRYSHVKHINNAQHIHLEFKKRDSCAFVLQSATTNIDRNTPTVDSRVNTIVMNQTNSFPLYMLCRVLYKYGPSCIYKKLFD